MGPGSVNVSRELPIDAALLAATLLRLRRDLDPVNVRWTLGDRGAVEIDLRFTEDPASQYGVAIGAHGPTWTTTGRLWDPAQLAVVGFTASVTVATAAVCLLRIEVAKPLNPWWAQRRSQLLALAQAALHECAEEMLWHATRDGIAHAEH